MMCLFFEDENSSLIKCNKIHYKYLYKQIPLGTPLTLHSLLEWPDFPHLKHIDCFSSSL